MLKLGLLLVLLGSLIYGQTGTPYVGVCQVFADLVKYDKQVIRVEGELVAGKHGMELASAICPNADKRWRTAICLMHSADPSAPRVGFATEGIPLFTIGTATRALIDEKTGFRSRAIIEGQLFVAEPGGGYCQANTYRVEMVVTKVLQFSVNRGDEKSLNETGDKESRRRPEK